MQQAIAQLVLDADELLGKIRDTVARDLRDTREFVQDKRGFLEGAVNAIFATMVSYKVKGLPREELKSHILSTYPKVLTANSAAALVNYCDDHLKGFQHLKGVRREARNQAVSNSVNLGLNIDKLERDPKRFLSDYGATWALTQPLRIVTMGAFEALIGGLRKLEQVVKRDEEADDRRRR